jgi:putative transposase
MPGSRNAIISSYSHSRSVMPVYGHPFITRRCMSRNHYSEINLHLTWHCKLSAPMLNKEIESVTQRIIRNRIFKTPEVLVREIGGTDTHVHIAVTVPPTLTISTFVGQVKGASSHDVNQHFATRGKVLEWQAGYGVVTFRSKDLPWVRDYVRKQREHHASGKAVDRLERIAEQEAGTTDRNPVNGVDNQQD